MLLLLLLWVRPPSPRGCRLLISPFLFRPPLSAVGRYWGIRTAVPGRLGGVDAGGGMLREGFLRAAAGVRAAREQKEQQRVARGRGGRGKGLRDKASQQTQSGGEFVVSIPPRPVMPRSPPSSWLCVGARDM